MKEVLRQINFLKDNINESNIENIEIYLNNMKIQIKQIVKEDGKYCDWCSGIIGSGEYKTFVSTGDPKEEIYFHIFCYKILKNKGIIGDD